ncbi:MAG: L,D-transpeptidase family protein [Gemmatimonadaceae bacterium]
MISAFLALASVLTHPVPAAARLDDSVAVKTTYVVEKGKGGGARRVAPAADSVVVEKATRRLTLFFQGMPLKSYVVALGRNPVGDKVRIGDNRTPEGLFHIATRNATSKFYRSLRISYPDAAHQMRADAMGVSPGGDIMIHGLPAGREQVGGLHRKTDWTEGCIALTNQEIDEIWSLVPDGVPIQIKP